MDCVLLIRLVAIQEPLGLRHVYMHPFRSHVLRTYRRQAALGPTADVTKAAAKNKKTQGIFCGWSMAAPC